MNPATTRVRRLSAAAARAVAAGLGLGSRRRAVAVAMVLMVGSGWAAMPVAVADPVTGQGPQEWALDTDHVVQVGGEQARGPLTADEVLECSGLNNTVEAGTPPYECHEYSIDCYADSGLETLNMWLALRAAGNVDPVDTAGMLLLFSGGGGENWWSDLDTLQPGDAAATLVNGLSDDHFQIGLVRWESSWFHNNLDTNDNTVPPLLGYNQLSCRPAEVINFVYHQKYRGPTRDDSAWAQGRCGFCVSGESSGASAIGYALAKWSGDATSPIDKEIDAAVLAGGPPMGREDAGCMDDPATNKYGFQGTGALIPGLRLGREKADDAYGVNVTVCHDGPWGELPPEYADWKTIWRNDSVSFGGDYVYPDTRVYVMVGQADTTASVAQGDTLLDAIRAADPNPSLPTPRAQCIAGMSHVPRESDPAFWAALDSGVRWTSGDYGVVNLHLEFSPDDPVRCRPTDT